MEDTVLGQYRDEREIDLKQMLWYLWDHKVIILAFGIIFSVLLGVYTSINTEVGSDDITVDDIIQTNKEADPAHLGAVYTTTFYDLPEGAYFIEANIELDYNLDRIYSRDNAYLSDALNVYGKDVKAVALQNSSLKQVINELNLHQYEDMSEIEARDLYYLVNSTCDASGLLKIQITDTDPKRGEDIVNLLTEKFVNNSSMLEAVNGVNVLSGAEIVGYRRSDSGGVLGKFKYPIIGFVAGVALITIILIAVFLLNDVIYTNVDLESLKLDVIGNIPTNEKKAYNEIRRCAYNIAVLEGSVVSIVPVSDKSDAVSVSSIIKDELEKIGKKIGYIKIESEKISNVSDEVNKIKNNNDITLVTTKGLTEAPDAILAAKESDKVLFVVTYGKTMTSDLYYAIKEIERTGSDICGVIMTEVKHRL